MRLGDHILPCVVGGGCLRRGAEDRAELAGFMLTDTLFGLKIHLVRCSHPVKRWHVFVFMAALYDELGAQTGEYLWFGGFSPPTAL